MKADQLVPNLTSFFLFLHLFLLYHAPPDRSSTLCPPYLPLTCLGPATTRTPSCKSAIPNNSAPRVLTAIAPHPKWVPIPHFPFLDRIPLPPTHPIPLSQVAWSGRLYKHKRCVHTLLHVHGLSSSSSYGYFTLLYLTSLTSLLLSSLLLFVPTNKDHKDNSFFHLSLDHVVVSSRKRNLVHSSLISS
ncbi:hypothetical protein GGR51DRAFT_300242 [Nemania sp. FL0031]|nr:hypothetical protein GGR51DRAFT_300242 [Nemania sp. FL0031]